MEVFQTDNFYIFVNKDKTLWWNRSTHEFETKNGWDLLNVDDIECLGITHGLVGIVQLQGIYEPHLLLIKEVVPVGVLYAPHMVYKIKTISVLSPSESLDVPLSSCSKHRSGGSVNNSPAKQSGAKRLFDSNPLVNKTWGAVKSGAKSAAALATNQVKPSSTVKDPAKIGKKVTEELHRIFDDSDSFFFSLEGDITNNLQRQGSAEPDDRFYWNKHMLKDIIALNDPTWVLPVIQGFAQVEHCSIDNENYYLALVSRRSRYRAGTRYKRRGVDDQGHVANYVETEQILTLRHHQLSFTQVRGSVPVFWSQPGYKYRPPPRIDKGESETNEAFRRHFDRELDIYKSICVINLTEQAGKEKVISDSYARHIVNYNSEQLIYVSFDFHSYCRGMRFENVSTLIEAVAPQVAAGSFCWKDSKGMICQQKAIFRVNCIDCLDRTNVVQTALGKTVLEMQLVKLGLHAPFTALPDKMKAPFMLLWANNGDIISRQYAGTNALKGDYTRTGERKVSGMLKDGVNSANRFIIQNFYDTLRQHVIDLMQGNEIHTMSIDDDVPRQLLGVLTDNLPVREMNRGYAYRGVMSAEQELIEALILQSSYYLARFKDSYRQATIDLMVGNEVSAESLAALGGQASGTDEADALEGAEHARILVEDCRRMLIGSTQLPIGAWGLIDADPTTGDPNETEVDTILLLTSDTYITAEYDSQLDKIVRFEEVPLENITMIEIGMYQPAKLFPGSQSSFLCIRINYTVDGNDGYFHMFRSPNIRFFNNVAVVIKKPEEITESMNSIVEFFRIALDAIGHGDVPIITSSVMQRRKSRSALLGLPNNNGMPRNLSESQLVQMGSKALSNVTGQFSKLGQAFKKDKGERPTFHIGTAPQTGTKLDDQPSSGSDDGHVSEAEEVSGDVLDNTVVKDSNFLESVGIVMAAGKDSNTTTVPANPTNTPGLLEDKDNLGKVSSDVCTMSISSITDNITMPSRLLQCDTPKTPRSRSPAPQIRVDADPSDQSDGGNDRLAPKYSSSVGSSSPDVSDRGSLTATPTKIGAKDLTLNLTTSHSDNAIKQLKSLTSPFSKIAKGVQNIGANLDPRKIASSTKTVLSPSAVEPHEDYKQKLQQMWVDSSCKTKLIAL